MHDKAADYERVLRDLSTRVSDADAELIRTTLERVIIPRTLITRISANDFSLPHST